MDTTSVEEVACLICETTDPKILTALQCCHLFCSDCVIKLIRIRNRKCPVCRTKIVWNVPMLLTHNKLRSIDAR